ncbi:MAG TPA: metalloregulator ArsR/SmtB family transcription factor [Bryobacteraceae bacterium]|nr:metalloregulator ArsR/SmtB family transcription factor [Bryobacteraceae bacterium]
MAEFLKSLRVLSDEGRIRILRVLEREELSVAELQEILGMGQSRISMQLSQLKQGGFVEVRRAGQKSLYRLAMPAGIDGVLAEILRRSATEIREAAKDDEGLRLALERRKDKLRGYFDDLAGRFGRNYVPGRSWKGLAEVLLRLLPPLVIADLGAGEGTLSLMLAQTAERVIAVDSSEKMVNYGRDAADRNGVENLEYRLGDLEELPLNDAEADIALLHQSLHHALHPRKAVEEAWRILKPGGRIVILDLRRHGFEQARDLYADVWLGFSHVELSQMLAEAHFSPADIAVVHREEEAPHFETVMAMATKPNTLSGN